MAPTRVPSMAGVSTAPFAFFSCRDGPDPAITAMASRRAIVPKRTLTQKWRARLRCFFLLLLFRKAMAVLARFLSGFCVCFVYFLAR